VYRAALCRRRGRWRGAQGLRRRVSVPLGPHPPWYGGVRGRLAAGRIDGSCAKSVKTVSRSGGVPDAGGGWRPSLGANWRVGA